MIVNIDEQFRVRVDEMNYTLEKFIPGGKEVKAPKTGEVKITKDKWGIVGYYPNIRQAVHRVIHEKVLCEDKVLTLEGYIDELKNMYGEYKSKYL